MTRANLCGWTLACATFLVAGAARAEAPDVPAYKPAAPRKAGRTFGPDTAPQWVVAATTPAAYQPSKAPPRNWRPQKRWALTPVAGTDGAGLDLSYQATRALVLRLRGAWLGAKHAGTYDGVRYDGKLDLMTGGAFVDIHPLPGRFTHPLFLSLGAVDGRRRASIHATPQGSVTYGGHTYTAAQIGTVSGDIRLPDLAPFVGAGWDNTFDSRGALGVRLLAGAVVSSRPEVSLRSTGGLSSATAMLQTDLMNEQAKVAAAANALRYYPVVSAGLSFKF